MPEPVYEWYKDGVRLSNIPGKLNIVRNVLTLQNLQTTDNGMYQCSAENIYGKSFTEGQLRVLGITLLFRIFNEKKNQYKLKQKMLEFVIIKCQFQAQLAFFKSIIKCVTKLRKISVNLETNHYSRNCKLEREKNCITYH